MALPSAASQTDRHGRWRGLLATDTMASGSTLRRRLADWAERGVLGHVHSMLVGMMRGQPDLARDLIVDSCSVRAKRGGELTGPNPTNPPQCGALSAVQRQEPIPRRSQRGRGQRKRRAGGLRGDGDPLSPVPIRPADPALHRLGLHFRTGAALVRAALARGGHVPRSARPPRGRDAATMVGSGHRTHDALPARLVLPRHPAESPTHASGTPSHSDQRLVSRAALDLLRSSAGREPRDLARIGFRPVPQTVGCAKTPASPQHGYHLRALSIRMTPKSSLGRDRRERNCAGEGWALYKASM